MAVKIEIMRGREIYNSSGIPTIACDLMLNDGTWITASVPSGISRGRHEAVELRDGGKRLMGMGVRKAVEKLNMIIAPACIKKEPNVVNMDMEIVALDGTDDKSNLGANTILAASMAICKAQAIVEMMELYELIAHLCEFDSISMPSPMFNLINGGLHTDTPRTIQEFMLVPTEVGSFREAMELGATVFYELQEQYKARGKRVMIGLEGGLVADLGGTTEILDCLLEALEKAKKRCAGTAKIALDVAASHLFESRGGYYYIDGKKLSTNELLAWYLQLIDEYGIYAIEDGLHEDDWDGWIRMTELMGDKVLLVGDDLYATNPERIWHGIEKGAGSAVIIKPNQIGTVTETLQAVKLCYENDRTVIVSHRSQETNDTFIADLAVAVSANHIKAGGCSRGERLAKYNYLLMIEDALRAGAGIL
jgi:enolase